MSLKIETIPFTVRTGIGTQTINHVEHTSTQARALIFVNGKTSGGSLTWGVGFDDGTTHIGNSLGVNDSFGQRTARGYDSSYSIVASYAQAFFGGASTQLRGYVSALNVGSFDVTFDLNNDGGSQWYAIMIGGDDVECKVGIYDMTPGSGTVNVGFDPVALLKLSAPDVGSNAENSGAYHSYGFGTLCGSDVQVGFGTRIADGGVSNPNATSYQIEDVIQQDDLSNSTTLSDPVTISFVTDGFSVTGSPAASDWNIGYLAIGGSAVSANLVPIIQPTSTGVQNTAITAADPIAVFFGSVNAVTTSGASVLDSKLTFGVHTENPTTPDVCQWWGVTNNLFSRARRSSTSSPLVMATSTGALASTVNATATCTLSSGNIALNWTTVDATQREVWALVLAQNPDPLTPDPCGGQAAPATGTIVVIKATDPVGSETLFTVSAGGGLDPASFTIQDGETVTFTNVPVGSGYSIIETIYDIWDTDYDVSTDESNEGFTVSEGQTTTIIITNTRSVEQSGEVYQWRLHRFDLKFRNEETA